MNFYIVTLAIMLLVFVIPGFFLVNKMSKWSNWCVGWYAGIVSAIALFKVLGM